MQVRSHLRQVALVTALIGALAAVTAFGVAPIADSALPPAVTVTEQVPIAIVGSEPSDSFLQSELIRRGDTLASVLSRLGANDPEFLRFVALDPVAKAALTLRPGRTVRTELDSLGRVLKFAYRGAGLEDDASAAQDSKRLVIRRNGDTLTAREEVSPIERSTEMRSAEVRSTLFAATDAAGIPESVAVQIAEIFGSDIDLQRDLKRGDRLRVVYELLREGDSFDGAVATRVLAAELTTGGKAHQAVWFERHGRGEYYGFDGKSLKKDFLLNPLEFSRVTSGFTEARLHPIMRDWRAHKGVDFGAPIGTRVRSSADGVIEYIGMQRGYGNVVFIKHAKQMTTVYAHLQDFTEGLKAGSKVDQGEIIGTVGTTGWSTGPHLHYELRIAGEHVDPLAVAVPDEARKLGTKERGVFTASIAAVRHRFALLNSVRTASFQ